MISDVLGKIVVVAIQLAIAILAIVCVLGLWKVLLYIIGSM